MTSPTATAEIERLEQAATKGPWVGFSDGIELVAIMPAGRDGDICEFSTSPSEADGQFMIACRQAVPALLAALRAVEADLGRAVEQCLDQQKLLDEYKALHLEICAERDTWRDRAVQEGTIGNGFRESFHREKNRAEAAEAALRAAEAERDAAVAAEREACAQIVERMIDVVLSSHMRITLGMCVQDIRARAALHTSAKEGKS